MKTQLCAVALLATTALSANVQADDFTYLSGGAIFNKQGLLAEINKAIDTYKPLTDEQKKDLKNKTSGGGLYLNGSVGFENNVFVEGRFQNSRQLSNYLLGVGYHYPVMQQVDVYGLVGVSKRHIEFFKPPTVLDMTGDVLATAADMDKRISMVYQDQIKPTAEIGVKVRLNDVAGLQAAYRFAQFGNKSEKTWVEKCNLHEGRLTGYYKVTENLAVEAGYTYNKYSKLKTKDHTGQLGLRYNFS